MQLYTSTCRIHIDAIITMSEDFFKKYTSHFIWKGCVCERELETEQNSNILIPTLMAISVSFPLSRAAQPEAWGAHSAECRLSLPHLVTNGSALQTLQTNRLPVFTELYNSSIDHSIFGMACLIVIKRK